MDYMLINKKDVFHAIVYYNSMESSTQSLEKWIFTRNSPWFYYSSTPFKIGVHLRTYTVIFKYTHTNARTNLLVGTKIYALHIACIETDLSLMNVFHLSLMIEKHDIQPFDIFPFCSLQSSSCRNWNDLTHIFFLNYQGIADEDFIFAAITIIVCFPNK